MNEDDEMKQWWGTGIGSAGWGCLVYAWIHEPLTRWGGGEPWSVTTFGLVLVGTCVGINLLQLALGEQPLRRPR